MKYVAILSAALALSGCASWNERFHGSWLDRVGKPANPPIAMSDQNAALLDADVVRLRAEAEGIRMKLASEKSRVRRMAYLRNLQDIGDKLHPAERALHDAGRVLPGALRSAAPSAS